jgi:hypothetical protein
MSRLYRPAAFAALLALYPARLIAGAIESRPLSSSQTAAVLYLGREDPTPDCLDERA